MNVPTLDLHGLRHHEVGNEVARFIESWLGNDLFLDVITGKRRELGIVSGWFWKLLKLLSNMG
jgi:DNA-nicking Smr family endonuclease